MILRKTLLAGGAVVALLASASVGSAKTAAPAQQAATKPGPLCSTNLKTLRPHYPDPVKPLAGAASSLSGAGSTFVNPIMSLWASTYAGKGIKVAYQSIGSGGGIAQIQAQTVDFGDSDIPMLDTELSAAKGGPILHIPVVVGGVVLTYNVKGVGAGHLHLDGPTIGKIFAGEITKWDDPAIKALNPSAKLPDEAISVVHRSDGSGTTFAFTDYLSKISDEWKSKVGSATSVKWPSGLGGKGSDGVAGTIAQNDGALGYIELAYAVQNKLAYGSVQNKAGNYVTATTDAVQAAMADFGTNMGDKLAVSIANAPGANSWPIATYTYLLFYMDQQDCSKAQKIVAFYKWAQGADGLKDEAALQYIPLPDAVKTQALTKLGQITCQGKPLP